MGAPKVRWTQEEEDALRKGVKDHGTGRWKHIKHDPKYKEVLNNRSNVDLKDKWRNILVAEGAIEKPSARKGKKRKQQQANEDGGALEATNKTKAEIDQQAQEVMSQAVHNLQAKDNGPTTLTTGGTEAAAHTPLEKVISPGAQTGDESRPKASGGRKEGGGGGGEDSKSERLDFSSLPMEEKVIAAIIALKDDKATATAIQQSMQKIGDENKKANSSSEAYTYSLKEVNAKLKKMCNSGTLAKDQAGPSKGTYRILGLMRDGGGHSGSGGGSGAGGHLPPKKAKTLLSQISSKKSDDYKDLSTSEATVVAARAVAEALAAARTAEEAMAEAVELEQLVSVKKQQDQEKQQEEQEQEQEGGMNKHEDGSNDQNQVMDQTKPPKKR